MSFGKRVTAKQGKEAISQLKSIIKKIETGQMTVKDYGGWPGIAGEYNFKITLKEADIPKLSEELQRK